jgi:hypothetical protein
LDYSKDLTKVYEEFPFLNKFNTFIVDDLYGNVKHKSNFENAILIQPFAPFGTSKQRKQPKEQTIDISTSDDCFLTLIDICKKVIKDLKGCTQQDFEEGFSTEAVFSKKRVQRLKLTDIYKMYATQFTPLVTLGKPLETNKFIAINNYHEYFEYVKGGSGKMRKNSLTKKHKSKKNKTKKSF